MPMSTRIPGTVLPGSWVALRFSAVLVLNVLLILVFIPVFLPGLCTRIHSHRWRFVPGTLRTVRV